MAIGDYNTITGELDLGDKPKKDVWEREKPRCVEEAIPVMRSFMLDVFASMSAKDVRHLATWFYHEYKDTEFIDDLGRGLKRGEN